MKFVKTISAMALLMGMSAAYASTGSDANCRNRDKNGSFNAQTEEAQKEQEKRVVFGSSSGSEERQTVAPTPATT